MHQRLGIHFLGNKWVILEPNNMLAIKKWPKRKNWVQNVYRYVPLVFLIYSTVIRVAACRASVRRAARHGTARHGTGTASKLCFRRAELQLFTYFFAIFGHIFHKNWVKWDFIE